MNFKWIIVLKRLNNLNGFGIYPNKSSFFLAHIKCQSCAMAETYTIDLFKHNSFLQFWERKRKGWGYAWDQVRHQWEFRRKVLCPKFWGTRDLARYKFKLLSMKSAYHFFPNYLVSSIVLDFRYPWWALKKLHVV